MKSKVLIRLTNVFLIVLLSQNLLGQELTKVAPEKVGMSTERLVHLSNTFQEYVDNEKISGSVILLARKGQIAYFESFGNSDIENKVTMKNDAIFRIASQTKALVSVGIMILMEEGKLLITDPVGKYIPAFKETTVAEPDGAGYKVVKAKRPVTITDLLTHTAGIGYGYGLGADLWEKVKIQGWYFADRDEPIQATIERIGSLPFEAQPGERFVYGYNTDILGALIEVVSGESLDAFLKKRILDPLGMNDTHFYLPKEKKDRLAVVYSPDENGGLKKAPSPGGMVGQGEYVEGPRKSFSGGAGFLSTAIDYAKFLQMMLNKGTFNGNRVLSRKSVELMTSDNIGNDMFPWGGGTGFGLGFSVVTNFALRGELGSNGEFGWGGAYHSSYWVDPEEELVVVYFTQLIPDNGLDDHKKLRALIYQSIID